mmetsp:Transcript_13463/g.30538  ORF Transcript_13463/g.30538 Transcript_13463/m.30538 type:complete len:388 (+) Transcript_13463:41-1204(+)
MATAMLAEAAAETPSKGENEAVATEEVQELLSKIALERFSERFVEEEVDLETLALFEDRDLADLGLPKGPRVKLLRALKDVFAPLRPEGVEKIAELTQHVDNMNKQVDDMSSRVDEMKSYLEEKLTDLRRRIDEHDETSKETSRLDEKFSAHQQRLEELEESLATTNNQLQEVEIAHKASLRKQTSSLTAQDANRRVHAEVLELSDSVQELSTSLRSIQELIPRRVCWDVRHASEKMHSMPAGKYLRAPAFALCGSVVGLKLDFYPSGRHEALDAAAPEEGLLPDITPRKDGVRGLPRKGGQLADESWCSIGVCCPMGVKILYNLYVGQGHAVDNRSGEWTPTYHDFKLRWRDELEGDGSLRIVVTVLRVHNRRCPIEQDTIFIKSD